MRIEQVAPAHRALDWYRPLRHAWSEAMRIPGTVADWQDWTAMRFPESGSYVVPGALVPVEVDVEGLDVEPCVWMRHAR